MANSKAKLKSSGDKTSFFPDHSGYEKYKKNSHFLLQYLTNAGHLICYVENHADFPPIILFMIYMDLTLREGYSIILL
jgi:hypothetical protein